MATTLKRLVEKVYSELLSAKGEPQPAVGIPKRREVLQRQMAYGAALKVLLYAVLERELGLPSLADSGDLKLLIEEAWRRSGLEALRPSWIDAALTLLETGKLRSELRATVEALEKTPGDVLGRLYEELVPQEERRRLGEFYTPKPIAEFMVAWAVHDGGAEVLDPGVGSGTFLVEAVRRLRAMGAERPVERVVGVDVNPLAVLMATLNLLKVEPGSKPRVLLADFFDLSPLTLGYFSAVVCNPPYTRHHELSPEYKEKIARVVERETGLKVSRLSSLYLHFFLHASTFLSEGGRLAFITPSEWMEASYGYPLRLLFKRSLRLRAILLFREDALAFPGVLTRACITLAEKGGPAGRALLLKLREWPTTSELLEAVEEGREGDLGWGKAKLADLELLDPNSSWTPLFEKEWTPPPGTVELGELAKVVRGIATGANEFFLLSESDARRWGIEREFLKPAVPSARSLAKLGCLILKPSDWDFLRAKGEKVYLFWCRKRRNELEGTRALEYIEKGEESGYHQRYLTRHRSEWWWLEEREPPDAFLIYMFRRGLRAILNEAKVLAPNTLHCVYFRERRYAKAVLAYLNSSIALELAQHRVYGGGMRKIEPREAEKIPVPDPRLLSETELETLAALLDELDEAEREGRGERVRKALDEEVRRLLER
jgi:adenine-specific DNA methylase